MSGPNDNVSAVPAESIGEIAARWVLRREEGLSSAEERELAAWEAADPRHAAALVERTQAWARFEPLVAESGTGILPVERHGHPACATRDARLRFVVPALAAAAAIALGVFSLVRTRWLAPAHAVQQTAVVLPAPCERLALPDGSLVELNRGARVRAAFTATERRLHLELGEANFTVASDASRPFIVAMPGGLEARALGTVFNVRSSYPEVAGQPLRYPKARGGAENRLGAAAEVLVTEGTVRVTPPQHAPVTLTVRQRVVVAKDPTIPPRVETLSDSEIATYLAWQPQMLDFDDVPLSSVIAEFNRHNSIRLVVADPAIAAVRMNGTFRSDNVAGFARLLEQSYAIRFERGEADGAIVLRR